MQWRENELMSELPVKSTLDVNSKVDVTQVNTCTCSCQCASFKSKAKIQSSNNSQVHTSSEFLSKVKSKDFSPKILLRKVQNDNLSKSQTSEAVIFKPQTPQGIVSNTKLKVQNPKNGKTMWVDETKIFTCVFFIKISNFTRAQTSLGS